MGNYERGKAVVFKRPREAAVEKIRFPEVDEDTIVVKTKYSAISCGTEMAVYAGKVTDADVWYPCVPGYECVGEVVYAGPRAARSNTGDQFKEGDRVMANEVFYYPDHKAAWGGQCEYAIKNAKTSPGEAHRPAKIPDNVSYQEATIAYLACVAKKGLDMVGVNAGESVLVTGMGNIGLAAVQLAKAYGAGRVIAADIRETRLKHAKNYTPFLLNLSNPDACSLLLEMNEGKKADLLIECSGNADVIDCLPDYLNSGGRIHLQGQYREPIIITAYARWNCSNLRISCSIGINPGDKDKLLEMISKGGFDAKKGYTKEYFIDDAPTAYKDLEENRYDILKILFRWGDS